MLIQQSKLLVEWGVVQETQHNHVDLVERAFLNTNHLMMRILILLNQ